jgi:HPt (histidine-containing phosphotransfer) domain-containing protein
MIWRQRSDPAPRPVDEPIDRNVMRAVMGDDPELIQELAGEFLPGAREGIAEIVAAFDRKAADAVRASSHKLKGACALVGAKQLIALCVALEGAAKAGDWPVMGNLTGQLHHRFGDVEAAIEAFLAEMARG